MSELRRAVRGTITGVAAIFTVAVVVPHASAAQSAAQYRARLSATLRTRKAAMDSLDTLRARRALDLPPDSLKIGVVRVRYSKINLGPDLESTLRAAVQRAAAIADTQFGDAQLEGPEAVIVVNRVARTDVSSLSFDIVQLELPGPSGRMTTIRSPLTQRKLSDELLDMIGTLATVGVPLDVSRWAGYWAPSHPLTPDDWEAAALDLTTSNSSVSRTCYSGSVSGCEAALGLTAVHDSLAEWYTPEGWRALVSTWAPPIGDPGLAADHADCVEKKIMKTCKRLARMRHVPVPLNMSTRSTLFNLAIARGGRSAYTRLRNATGTPLEVLSAVAGVSPEVLVDDWRTRTLAAVPHAARPTGAEATALLAWTALFGFAATRRRPWR
jgi:hypothetical protein